MNCKNCGHVIPNGAAFCGKCGTPVTQSQPSPEYGQNRGDVRRPVNSGVRPGKGGKLKQMHIALCAMHVLQLIFWFTSFMYASVSFMGMSQKETISIAALCTEEETGFFTPLFIVLFLAAAVLAILPVLRNSMEKRRRMIFSKIVAVLTVAFMILLRVVSGQAIGEYASVGFTFTGWLFILDTIGIFVLTVFISSASRTAEANR